MSAIGQNLWTARIKTEKIMLCKKNLYYFLFFVLEIHENKYEKSKLINPETDLARLKTPSKPSVSHWRSSILGSRTSGFRCCSTSLLTGTVQVNCRKTLISRVILLSSLFCTSCLYLVKSYFFCFNNSVRNASAIDFSPEGFCEKKLPKNRSTRKIALCKRRRSDEYVLKLIQIDSNALLRLRFVYYNTARGIGEFVQKLLIKLNFVLSILIAVWEKKK